MYFGTSSWKYPGWVGQLYQRDRYLGRGGKFSPARFDRECLAEYAEVFPSVCGDFAFYQFYQQSFWDRLFAQVPPAFRFGFKAPEQITCPQFPNHPRYGAHAGQVNPDFLNPDLFARGLLERLEPYRDQVGYLVFEFPQFHAATTESNARFVDQLDRFLGQLPARFPYSVEIRTRNLFGPGYLACLARHQVGHVFNSWTRMPALDEQLDQAGSLTADLSVARLLLRPGRNYQEAVDRFEPYDRVQDPYPSGYRAAARLVTAARARSKTQRIYLAVNNRFVGNSLHAIAAIIRELES